MAFRRLDSTPLEVRVSLAGLGNVGRSVLRLLEDEGERYRREFGISILLGKILDRSFRSKDLSWMRSEVAFTDSIEEFLKDASDIVVELIGGDSVADRIITDSLEKRRAVVTANKLLMAQHGAGYLRKAAENSAYFGFEASVAGGIPIIRTLRRSFFADRIVNVRGILNGTCNFILSEMGKSGRPFQEVLAEAQRLGYAEADPTLDVSGRDTADKLAILSALSFGKWIKPQHIPTRGINEISPVDFLYARQLGADLRLLGVARLYEGNLCPRVSPFVVDSRSTLSKIFGPLNAVELTGKRLGASLLIGQGAGGDATAVSIVADILNAALWKKGEGTLRLSLEPEVAPVDSDAGISNQDERYPFYIRFVVNDRPGIIAALSRILAEHRINIDAVLQEKWHDVHNLPFIITVAPTSFLSLETALEPMRELDFNRVPPVAFPILRT